MNHASKSVKLLEELKVFSKEADDLKKRLEQIDNERFIGRKHLDDLSDRIAFLQTHLIASLLADD